MPAVSVSVGRADVMLTTPAVAFLPNSVPCGPRSTSTRSTSNRSERPDPLGPVTTPSMTTLTLVSTPLTKVGLPRPRTRARAPDEARLSSYWKDGTRRPSVVTLATPVRSSVCAVTALSEIGTSSWRSALRCAVTMISVTPPFCESACSGAGADACACACVATLAAVTRHNRRKPSIRFIIIPLHQRSGLDSRTEMPAAFPPPHDPPDPSRAELKYDTPVQHARQNAPSNWPI